MSHECNNECISSRTIVSFSSTKSNRIQNAIKERSVSSEEGTSIVLYNTLGTVPLSIPEDLPSTNALSQCICRQRSSFVLDTNSQLSQNLKPTDHGEDFVLFQDDSMIIFTSRSNLSVLKKCQHSICDGTLSVSIMTFDDLTYSFFFQACLTKFFQLFTVHGLYT